MSSGLVTLLRELVAIDSTSTRTNLPMVEVLQRHLTALGFACEVQRYRDEAGVEKANLLGTLGEGLPELALVGHSDCVPFDAGWTEALTLTERDGRLLRARRLRHQGLHRLRAHRGAAHPKGQLHQAVRADLHRRRRAGLRRRQEAARGGQGQDRSAPSSASPPPCAPFAPTRATAWRRSRCRERKATPPTRTPARRRSSAARGCSPGSSATPTGALREQTHPDFVPAFGTLNVGMASGGKAKNVIPGHMRLTLEWRPLPNQSTELVLHAVEKLIDECRAEDPGFDATRAPAADGPRLRHPGQRRRGGPSWPEASGRAPDTVSFGTEGPQLAALGAVPVVFGPGDITVAHQTGEYVPVTELQRAARDPRGRGAALLR